MKQFWKKTNGKLRAKDRMTKSKSKSKSRRNWRRKYKTFSNQLHKSSVTTKTTWTTPCPTQATYSPPTKTSLSSVKKRTIFNRTIWYQTTMPTWYSRVIELTSIRRRTRLPIRFITRMMVGRSRRLIRMRNIRATMWGRAIREWNRGTKTNSTLTKQSKECIWSKSTPSTNNTVEQQEMEHLTAKTARRYSQAPFITKLEAWHQTTHPKSLISPNWLSRL